MDTDPDSWEAELQELRKRQELGRAMGGPEKLERQRSNSRLNIRERIDRLLDPGSFDEVGVLAGRGTYGPDGEMTDFLPANFVFGRGKLDGRDIVVGGDDFTVRGGAMDASIRAKNEQCEAMANALRLPIVRLVEGTGGGGSVKTIEVIGRTYVPALLANAKAIANGQDQMETTIDGQPWIQPVFAYQAKCLHSINAEYQRLDTTGKSQVDTLLQGTGCERLIGN